MSAEQIQRAYYAETASDYDAMHGDDEPLARHALLFLSMLIESLGAKTLLDVGCGSGRTLAYLKDRQPHLRAWGVEPVEALREQAIAKGIDASCLFEGDGYALPFADRSFDVVCETAVLHHVERPALVVAEMCRTAKQAVAIADANRFGQGRMASRWLKLALCKSHLWPVLEFIRTKGKMHHFSETDGLFYSYSVYDNLNLLTEWADRLFLLSADDSTPQSTWLSPLLTASQMVALAIKD